MYVFGAQVFADSTLFEQTLDFHETRVLDST